MTKSPLYRWLDEHEPHGKIVFKPEEKQYRCACNATYSTTNEEGKNMSEDLLAAVKPKIKDQPIGKTTREVVVGAYFRHEMAKRMRSMFEIMQPNHYEEYTGQKYTDQVCLLASLLAQEFQAVTGYPILDMLVERGIVAKPDPNHPGVPDVAHIPPPPAPAQELGALRLDED